MDDTRRFGWLQAFGLSFYSPDLYRDVGRRWKGWGLGYLLLLLSLSWIPAMIRMHLALGRFNEAVARDYLPKFPQIAVRAGQVSTEPAGPHVFAEPGTRKPVLVIDTAAKSTDYPELEDGLLVTQSELVVRNSRKRETRTQDLSQVDGIAFGRDAVRGWLELGRRVSVPLAYPLLLALSFLYRVSLLTFYAAVAMLFGERVKALGYGTLVRLSAVALTPVVVLDTVVSSTGIQVPFWSLICLAVALGYLWMGANAAAEPDPAPAAIP